MIIGLGGDDVICGGAGNDRILAGAGSDRVTGGPGADRIEGASGDDVLRGGAGKDRILAGAGADLIQPDGAPSLLCPPTANATDVVDAGTGDDVVAASPGNDDLELGAGDDSARDICGDDRISGGAGDDEISSGVGADTVTGGDGDDHLASGAGNDTVRGGAGDDALNAGSGEDTADGEQGRDTVSGGSQADLVTGGPGADRVFGSDGADTVRVGAGDTAWEGAGTGKVVADPTSAEPGATTVCLGVDSVSYAPEACALPGAQGDPCQAPADPADRADPLGCGVATRQQASRDPERGAGDSCELGATDDVVVGSSGPDACGGGGGADAISGAGGPDALDGGPGADKVDGGSGADALQGGTGADAIDGGLGTDTAAGDEGDDVLAGGAGPDQLGGGAGNDQADGGAGDDQLLGDDGDDTLVGGAGADAGTGGAGNDALRGGNGPDRLDGEDGTDDLQGEGGTDTLLGGAGDDKLDGGGDPDAVTGGSGTDAAAGGPGDDVIVDGAGADSSDGGAGFDTTTVGEEPAACTNVEQAFGCSSAGGTVDTSLPVAGAPPEAGTCNRFAHPAGDDADAGTASAPWRTVERLVNGLAPGQTGCLAPGATFTEADEEINVRAAGQSGAPITLRSAPGPVRATVKGRVWVEQTAGHVTFADLVLDGTNEKARGQAGLPSPTVNGDDVSIVDSELRNPTGACVSLGFPGFGVADRTVVRRNRIHGCKPGARGGIGIDVVTATDTTIDGNVIVDNGDLGIYLNPTVSGATITNNAIVANALGIRFEVDGTQKPANVTVTRNVFSASTFDGYPDPVSNGTRTVGGPTTVPQPVSNSVTDNCIWHPNPDLRIQTDNGQRAYTQGANLFVEPTFVDFGARDLVVTGPCADRGPAPFPARNLVAVPIGPPAEANPDDATDPRDDAEAGAAPARESGLAGGEVALTREARARVATVRVRALVAFGDSYSSGEGINWQERVGGVDYRGGDCHRHPYSYRGWAALSGPGIAEYRYGGLYACSGGVSANVHLTPQNADGGPSGTQLAEFARAWTSQGFEPSDIVLTLGGNDVGFSSLILACVKGRALPGDATRCEQFIRAADVLTGSPTRSRVGGALGAISDASPRSVITLVSYPVLFHAKESTLKCLVSRGDRATFARLTRKLTRSQRSAIRDQVDARGRRFRFLDINSAYDTHRLCDGNNENDYIVPLRKFAPQAAHPKSSGHQATGERLRRCLHDGTGCPFPSFGRDPQEAEVETSTLPAPQGVQLNGSTVRWAAVAGAAGYEVRAGGPAGETLAEVEAVAAPAVTLSARPAGCVVVVAFDQDATPSPPSACTAPAATPPPGGGGQPTPPAPAYRAPRASDGVERVCQGRAAVRSVTEDLTRGTNPISRFELVDRDFGTAHRFEWRGDGSYSITGSTASPNNKVISFRWRATDTAGGSTAVVRKRITLVKC